MKATLLMFLCIALFSCSGGSLETTKASDFPYYRDFKNCLSPSSFQEEKITLNVSILIGFAGKVLSSSVESINGELSKETSDCLNALIKKTRFEPREGAGVFWIREKLEVRRGIEGHKDE